MDDYVVAYTKGDKFDLPALFNDDYFKAIKLLWNNKHYVSAMKLLLSAVDTFGFLEYGDKPGSFQSWLDQYADLNVLGVTAAELWELRNSLLHMTNLQSRKVAAGNVRRLLFYVGHLPPGFRPSEPNAAYLGMWQLIQCVVAAMETYFEAFAREPEKFVEMATRYDLVVSDVRYLKFDT